MGVSWGSVAWAPSSARVPCGDQWEGALGGQDVWCWRGDWDPLWEESFLPRPLRTSSWMELTGQGVGGRACYLAASSDPRALLPAFLRAAAAAQTARL